MPPSHLVADWQKTLIAAVATTLIVLAALFILRPASAAHAQGHIQLEIDKQLRGSNLIRVGQELTFTIRIRNNRRRAAARGRAADSAASVVIMGEQAKRACKRLSFTCT